MRSTFSSERRVPRKRADRSLSQAESGALGSPGGRRRGGRGNEELRLQSMVDNRDSDPLPLRPRGLEEREQQVRRQHSQDAALVRGQARR